MKKIAIIGGGMFGITAYLILKGSGFECFIFKKHYKICANIKSELKNEKK